MALVVPNASEDLMLQNILNKTAPETLVLKLYTNIYTPVETSTAANFTEAVGNGYASVSLTPANWTITPGAPTSASYPQVTFTFTGNLGNVYGYFCVTTTSLLLLFGEIFTDGPYNIVNNGDQIKISLFLSLE